MRSKKLFLEENILFSAVMFLITVFVLILIYKNVGRGMMEIMRDSFISVATITASLVAINGLYVWRRQLKGTSEYQVSEKILEKTYELQDALRRARVPFVSVAELSQREQERKAEATEATQEKSTKDEAYALWKRIEPAFKIIADLKIAKFKARALWGEEEIKDIDSFIHKAYELSNAQSNYFMMRINPQTRDEELMDKYWRIVYEMPKKEDSFWKEVEGIVSKIENKFRPYLT